jgi:hypothetical protein
METWWILEWRYNMGILSVIIETATFGGTIGALVAEVTGASIAEGTLTGMAVGGGIGVVVGLVDECGESYV